MAKKMKTPRGTARANRRQQWEFVRQKVSLKETVRRIGLDKDGKPSTIEVEVERKVWQPTFAQFTEQRNKTIGTPR